MKRPLGQKHNPELRRLYEVEELSLRQIAKHYGVSHQAVHDRLLRMGVTLRERSRRRELFEAEVLRELYVTNGLTLAEVGAKLNVTPYFVTRELKRHGIPRRKTGARSSFKIQKTTEV